MVVVVALLQVLSPPARAERPRATWDTCWRMDIACAKEADHFTGKACRRARRCFDQVGGMEQ